MKHPRRHWSHPRQLAACLVLAAVCSGAQAVAFPAPAQAVAPAPHGPPAADSREAAETESIRELRRLLDTGHPDQALEKIAALKSTQPPLAGLSRMEGLAHYEKSELQAADQAFAQALLENPADREAAQMRGLTLFRLGRPADAIPLLEAARGTPTAAAANNKTDPNYLLALCYMDTRRYDDARHAFAAQFGFPPDSASAYLLAARMLLRREFLPVSQTFAEQALKLEPTLPLAHALLGEIALAGNHLDDAITQFEQERRANPLEPSIYDRLGDAYNRAARYDDAQASLQQALLLEPNATGPYILLGKTMLKKGDAVAAITYLQRAAKMDPANYMTHSLLGQAYRTLGRTDDASRETATAQRLQTASEPKLESLR